MVFPVSEIMLQVVSVVFKDVVVLILYLPAGPGTVRQQLDILITLLLKPEFLSLKTGISLWFLSLKTGI
jgi:hypothetical protein